jgi:hypothetical protein
MVCGTVLVSFCAIADIASLSPAFARFGYTGRMSEAPENPANGRGWRRSNAIRFGLFGMVIWAGILVWALIEHPARDNLAIGYPVWAL